MTLSVDIMDRLKAETQDLHDKAESHPFQSRLVKGALSLGGYGDYLDAMFRVHQALENGLIEAGKSDRTVGAFACQSRFRAEALRNDLAHLGRLPTRFPAPEPISDFCRLLQETRRTTPVSLLGHFYVLEGSTNGTRFIARAVRRAYRLTGIDGTAYLDPYGDDQRAQWAQFKEQMRALDLSNQARDMIVDGAKAMFRGVVAISDALIASECRDGGTCQDLETRSNPEAGPSVVRQPDVMHAVV